MRHDGVGSLRQAQQTVLILDRCQDLFDPQVFLHICVVLLLISSSSRPAVYLQQHRHISGDLFDFTLNLSQDNLIHSLMDYCA